MRSPHGPFDSAPTLAVLNKGNETGTTQKNHARRLVLPSLSKRYDLQKAKPSLGLRTASRSQSKCGARCCSRLQNSCLHAAPDYSDPERHLLQTISPIFVAADSPSIFSESMSVRGPSRTNSLLKPGFEPGICPASECRSFSDHL